MQNSFLLSAILLISTMVNGFDVSAQTPVVKWEKSYSYGVNLEARHICFLGPNRYLLAGNVHTDSQFIKAQFICVDTVGNLIWQKSFNRANSDNTVNECCSFGTESFVFAGNTTSHNDKLQKLWVAASDSTGVIKWEYIDTSSYQSTAHSIVRTKNNEFLICGTRNGNCLLIKIDSLGHILWLNEYARTSPIVGKITFIPKENGKILLAFAQGTGPDASFTVIYQIDSNGTLEWSKFNGPTSGGCISRILSINDGYIIGGSCHIPQSDHYFYWLQQIDTTGVPAWSKINILSTNGELPVSQGLELQIMPDNGYVMVSDFLASAGGYGVVHYTSLVSIGLNATRLEKKTWALKEEYYRRNCNQNCSTTNAHKHVTFIGIL